MDIMYITQISEIAQNLSIVTVLVLLVAGFIRGDIYSRRVVEKFVDSAIHRIGDEIKEAMLEVKDGIAEAVERGVIDGTFKANGRKRDD